MFEFVIKKSLIIYTWSYWYDILWEMYVCENAIKKSLVKNSSNYLCNVKFVIPLKKYWSSIHIIKFQSITSNLNFDCVQIDTHTHTITNNSITKYTFHFIISLSSHLYVCMIFAHVQDILLRKIDWVHFCEKWHSIVKFCCIYVTCIKSLI